MLGYLARRLAYAASLVAATSFGAFVAFGSSFDPTYSIILQGRHSPQRVALQHQFHLTDPILVRYWLWVKGLVHHGFGTTVMGGFPGSPGTPIGQPLWSALAVTAQLLATSLVLVVVFSVLVGTVSARRPGSALDVGVRIVAYVSWSLPTFLVGVLLLRWLGPYGWFAVGRPRGGVVTWVRTMALPALTLSLGLVGLYSRYIRSAMIVQLRQPYATVARGKGLAEREVMLRHALRNSLVPFVSVLSLELGAIVGASLATDYVFRMDGLASYFFQAVSAADPFQLTAILVVLAGTVAVFALLGDAVVGRLDPRIRAGASRSRG